MSTSEQHDTRHDTLSGEPPLVEDEYAADQPRDGAVDDFSEQERADRDASFAPGDTTRTDPRGTGATTTGATTTGATTEEPLVSDAPAAEDTQPARTDGTVAPAGGTSDSTAAAPDRAPLVSADRADSYASRWNEVKGMFVDEPRQAVQQADQLVGELLDDLERGFREQRQGIERGLENDDTSTEDLRMALRRYRSFFDRLLSV